MPNYRRLFIPGGTWFFTVNLLQRQNNNLLVREINLLRNTVNPSEKATPFILTPGSFYPINMHAVWTLPENDADFSTRWRLIKSGFSRGLPKTEYRSAVRIAANERGIWQRHYWEHAIRDELDFERHIDYVYINPMKHQLVTQIKDWPYSRFHRYVESGIYPLNWGGGVDIKVDGGE